MRTKPEITIELTDYCPHHCKFCSSVTTRDKSKAIFISVETVEKILGSRKFGHIVLSGGEPLAHPDFYTILSLCSRHTGDVVVYANALSHVASNAHVLDGIYVEAAVTVPAATDKIRLLKRVSQGRERARPEVTFSRNFGSDCSVTCSHIVVRPSGEVVPSPCRKGT